MRPSPVVREGHNLLSILAGFALYGVMVQAHAALIGVPVERVQSDRRSNLRAGAALLWTAPMAVVLIGAAASVLV